MPEKKEGRKAGKFSVNSKNLINIAVHNFQKNYLIVIVQGLTSPPTQYRLYGRRLKVCKKDRKTP